MFPLSEVKEGNVRIEQPEFDERFGVYAHFETIQLNNRCDHCIEMVEDRGGIVNDERKIIAKKKLNKFTKEIKDEVIALMSSKALWDRYAELKEKTFEKLKESQPEAEPKEYVEEKVGNITLRRWDK